jgi:hypothetical protein
MSPCARPLACAVLGVSELGLGVARQGLGLPVTLSLAGALAALLDVREYWHG